MNAVFCLHIYFISLFILEFRDIKRNDLRNELYFLYVHERIYAMGLVQSQSFVKFEPMTFVNS